MAFFPAVAVVVATRTAMAATVPQAKFRSGGDHVGKN